MRGHDEKIPSHFPFESGSVALPNGRCFIPNCHKIDRWILGKRPFFACLGPSFEILYLITGNVFVLVKYESDEFADRTPCAQELTADEALRWLTRYNMSLPDCLTDRVEWAAELPLRRLLADAKLVKAIRKDWPTFNPERGRDVENLRACLQEWFRIPLDQTEELTPKLVLTRMEELDREAEAKGAGSDVHVGTIVVESMEVGELKFKSFKGFIGDEIQRQGAPRTIPFPTPDDAKWSDVNISFVDGHTVLVQVIEKKRRYTYGEMGMTDARSGRPNLQWELLKSFANGKGILTWESPDATAKNQKRRELLAHALRTFFEIESDPFVSINGGWQSLFNIEPER